MDFVPGDPLDNVWEGLNDGQKDVLVEDLRKYVSELRELKGKRIGALNGGPTRLITGYQTVQEEWPFESEGLFNQFQEIQGIDTRMHASQDDDSSQSDDSLQDKETRQEKAEIVFTHGDLVPRNILVNDKGNITALVDWEFAGYYPKYWEYSRASRETTMGWKDFLVRVFPNKDDWGSAGTRSSTVRRR
ncbi:hypothetical protein BDV38DRAFT_241251 [Aspergillus pseudotamarii]|uniref:Aminoglycoside phosphotransferase domain-containing protein n=1 Tax=Aspergillus pseudotamarii TaxID=132259 RepID=A0A5N6SYS1_ASPPS|nr:uncharacterized protein BDV38DRAFT_241251 [Aspergillus pseudotamarii]KAE8139815.1 hypothetical protein BDV38DRAFT_241251 [Aspergillus pseudotamarii]